MIGGMAGDIKRFVMVFLFFWIGTAHALYAINVDGHKSLTESMWTLYNMLLGDFDFDNYKNSEYSIEARLIFFFFTLAGPIMMLNLLIAMMGNSYSRITERIDLYFKLEKYKMILGYQKAMNGEVYRSQYYCRALYRLKKNMPVPGIRDEDFVIDAGGV